MICIKIAIVLGTRPEIIRFSPMLHYLKKEGRTLGVRFFVIHSGQHYDYEMDSIFFKEIGLQKSKYNLGVGSGTQTEQMCKISILIENVLKKEKPNLVFVYGDTNTTLAGALASTKLQIPVAHVEAGCRSFDMNMPEEINRICVDHVSRLLFPPDKIAYDNLTKEGVEKSKIFMCGNTHMDACMENYEISKRKSDIKKKLGLEKEYGVITLHRQENVDNKERLENILKAVNEIELPIVFPIHPRTKKMIELFGLERLINKLIVTKPLGYLDFLNLVGDAKVVFTDSGGIQVESNILGVPCIVVRDTTEWINELNSMSFLVSDKKELILKAYEDLQTRKDKIDYSEHRGSSERIIKTILDAQKKGQLNVWKKSGL